MIAARVAQSPEYYLTPDCPTIDGKIEARWGGKGAKLLGLVNELSGSQWRTAPAVPESSLGTLSYLRLAKGLTPDTGSKLTARLKDNRRDAIDITMTVPKEASILIEVAEDERVKAALWEANNYAMSLWEKGAKVRVRKGGAQHDRATENMVWASFYHGTTRPISEPVAAPMTQDGVLLFRRPANDNRKATPDPHTHIHNYVPNITHDELDAKTPWKALKRHHFDIPAIEAKFHKRFAKNLRKIGYDAKVKTKVIEYKNMAEVPEELRERVKGRKPRYVTATVEIKGISEEMVGLFSRRQDGIQTSQRDREATGQKMTQRYKAKASQIIREHKAEAPTITKGELREEWRGRMTDQDRQELVGTVSKSKSRVKKSRLMESLSRWHAGIARHASKLRSSVVIHESEAPERSRNNGRSR